LKISHIIISSQFSGHSNERKFCTQNWFFCCWKWIDISSLGFWMCKKKTRIRGSNSLIYFYLGQPFLMLFTWKSAIL
jgi:hypothetical protein